MGSGGHRHDSQNPQARKPFPHFPFAFAHAFPAARLALYSGSVANRSAFSLPGKCLTGRPSLLTVHQPTGGPYGPELYRHHLIGFVGVVSHFPFTLSPSCYKPAETRVEKRPQRRGTLRPPREGAYVSRHDPVTRQPAYRSRFEPVGANSRAIVTP